jgi:hypothetical protein
MESETEDLPPATLPPNTPVSLLNFPDDSEWTNKFFDELIAGLIELSRLYDLGRLAGVTVGYDFEAALKSVDLGFESTKATEYTNNSDIVCVAKAMNVLRDGRPMAHVVYNANFVQQITDSKHPHHEVAINIIAHELGHVAELKWRDEAMPGLMLKYKSPTYVDALLLQMATTCWEEYAACRLSARFGNPEELLITYAANFNQAAKKALADAQQEIKLYRTHGDIEKMLIEAGRPLAMPFKLAGYFLGHLDGLELEAKPLDLCPDLAGSLYEPVLPEIWAALRKLWDTRVTWSSIAIFYDLVKAAYTCFAAAGIDLQKQANDLYYVNVPHTAPTMPNGEADMVTIQLQEQLKNSFGSNH